MNGLKNLTAPERHDAEHIYSGSGLKEVYGSLSGTAGSYGTMFCIVKIISAIVNIIYFAMLPSQGDVPPLGISMLGPLSLALLNMRALCW